MTSVLYTGANGRMATVLRQAMQGEFDRVRLFARTSPPVLFENEEVQLGDLHDANGIEEACDEMDVVVHLGGIADEASFTSILNTNIEGTYNVFEGARRRGVRRVIFASSNHVTGFYPVTDRVTTQDPPRPDSYYGVSKVFGEALGRLYHDKWGMEVICLRIGSFRPEPEDVRQLSIWLSHRDGAELVRRAIVAPDLGYLIAYGASANSASFWSDDDGAEALGYVPRDNAQDYAGGLARAGRNTAEYSLQGGLYTEKEYHGGSWV